MPSTRRRQTGAQTAQSGGDSGFCPAARLGRGLDRPYLPSTRARHGRLDAGATLPPPLAQRGRPRLCHPRGLARRRGHAGRHLAPPLGSPLWPLTRQGARRLDDEGAGRPGLGRPLAVYDQASPGLASLRTDQSPRPLSCVRLRPLATADAGGQPRGAAGGGPRDLRCPPARQRACTLLARWETGYRDPWLILTALPPTTVAVAWYALRAWIAWGFTDRKRGGGHGEQTTMLAPARAERRWLAVAVAPCGTVSGGGPAEVAQPRPQVSQLPEQHSARKRATGQRPARSLRGCRRGRLVILAARCLGQPLPVGYILPEPWPRSPETAVDRLWASPLLPKVA
jgi:hypothetical protein